MQQILSLFLLVVTYLLFVTSVIAANSSQPLIPDEQAVYNLNQNLIAPEAIKDQPSEPSLINKITSGIGDFFEQLLTKLPIINGLKLFAQSETIHQAQIPAEAQLPSVSAIDKLKGFLGGKTGVYSVSLPEGIGKTSDKIIDKEKQFQQANFPDGISPITGQ